MAGAAGLAGHSIVDGIDEADELRRLLVQQRIRALGIGAATGSASSPGTAAARAPCRARWQYGASTSRRRPQANEIRVAAVAIGAAQLHLRGWCAWMPWSEAVWQEMQPDALPARPPQSSVAFRRREVPSPFAFDRRIEPGRRCHAATDEHSKTQRNEVCSRFRALSAMLLLAPPWVRLRASCSSACQYVSTRLPSTEYATSSPNSASYPLPGINSGHRQSRDNVLNRHRPPRHRKRRIQPQLPIQSAPAGARPPARSYPRTPDS